MICLLKLLFNLDPNGQLWRCICLMITALHFLNSQDMAHSDTHLFNNSQTLPHFLNSDQIPEMVLITKWNKKSNFLHLSQLPYQYSLIAQGFFFKSYRTCHNSLHFCQWEHQTPLYHKHHTAGIFADPIWFQIHATWLHYRKEKDKTIISLIPLTPKISLVILLTVCHTVLVMIVWRIWYWINS